MSVGNNQLWIIAKWNETGGSNTYLAVTSEEDRRSALRFKSAIAARWYAREHDISEFIVISIPA